MQYAKRSQIQELAHDIIPFIYPRKEKNIGTD